MKKKIIAAVALVCASSFTFAQQAKGGADVGGYAGISGGRSSTSFTTQDFSVAGYTSRYAAASGRISESTDKRGNTWRVFLGYNFDQNWAIEGAYASLGESKFTLTGNSGLYAGATETFRLDHNSLSLAVKGTLPVSKEFDLFALLGGTNNRSNLNRAPTGKFATDMTALSTSASKSQGYGMGGLGIEYKPTKNIGIRAEYQTFGKFGETLNTVTMKTGRSTVDAWLIGASFKFQ